MNLGDGHALGGLQLLAELLLETVEQIEGRGRTAGQRSAGCVDGWALVAVAGCSEQKRSPPVRSLSP